MTGRTKHSYNSIAAPIRTTRADTPELPATVKAPFAPAPPRGELEEPELLPELPDPPEFPPPLPKLPEPEPESSELPENVAAGLLMEVRVALSSKLEAGGRFALDDGDPAELPPPPTVTAGTLNPA